MPRNDKGHFYLPVEPDKPTKWVDPNESDKDGRVVMWVALSGLSIIAAVLGWLVFHPQIIGG